MNATVLTGCVLLSISTFVAWEGVAWFTHKYIMHGFLWCWHRSHHQVNRSVLERNDLFAVCFSVPSIVLLYYFSLVDFNPYLISVGAGIFCYGIFYFVFHDIIVHQRIKCRLPEKSRYLQRMINAHVAHHRSHSREGCEAFGFLFAHRKYEPAGGDPKVDSSTKTSS